MMNTYFHLVILLLIIYILGYVKAIDNFNCDNDNDYLLQNPIERYHSLLFPHLWFCKSIDCLHRFTVTHGHCLPNKVIFASIVYDVHNDFMFPYFIPSLMNLFGNNPFLDSIFFFIDYKDYGIEKGNMIIDLMLRQLPSCTVFLVLHCAANTISFHPGALPSLRKKYGFERNVIMHLSHEIAYDLTATLSHHNCYGNESDMKRYYSLYDLVVKQYYYKPLHSLQNVEYLPLFTRDFNLLQSYKKKYGVKPINSRSQECFFSGRISYTFDTIEQRERKDILELMSKSKFPCTVAISEETYTADPYFSYFDYVKILGDTIFIVAPSGSSSETFRLYEALELGGIPLIVKQRPIVDYSTQWKNYPGPILSNWSQLVDYFTFLKSLSGNNTQICSASSNEFCDTILTQLFFQDIAFEEEFRQAIIVSVTNTDLYLSQINSTMSDLHTSRLTRYILKLQQKILQWYHQYKYEVSMNISRSILDIFYN